MSILTAQVVNRERQDTLRAARVDEAKCRAHIGRALSLLDAPPQLFDPKEPSFLVGLDTYRVNVDEIETELNRVPRGSLSQLCLKILQSLSAAAADHKSALQDWSDCVGEYRIYCDLTIDDCAVERRNESDCNAFVNATKGTDSELEFEIMRGTADIMRSDWNTASRRVTAAKKHLVGIGRKPRPINRPSPFIPRTDADVPGSVYGRTAQLMCTRDVPQKAIDACQSLHDVLAGGISEDEEADLNDALSGIVTAYGLDAGMEAPATTTQTT